MRKLGKPTAQRMALLHQQTAELLWHGRIETTVTRAKEIRSIAEKLVTLAVKTHGDTVKVTKTKQNLKNEKVKVEFINDGVRKLNARRKIMSLLPDLQFQKVPKESNKSFRARTKDINSPLIEKIFREYGPRYEARAEALKQGGGYTRIIRLGDRRGDDAPMAIIEMVEFGDSKPQIKADPKPAKAKAEAKAKPAAPKAEAKPKAETAKAEPKAKAKPKAEKAE